MQEILCFFPLVSVGHLLIALSSFINNWIIICLVCTPRFHFHSSVDGLSPFPYCSQESGCELECAGLSVMGVEGPAHVPRSRMFGTSGRSSLYVVKTF